MPQFVVGDRPPTTRIAWLPAVTGKRNLNEETVWMGLRL